MLVDPAVFVAIGFDPERARAMALQAERSEVLRVTRCAPRLWFTHDALPPDPLSGSGGGTFVAPSPWDPPGEHFGVVGHRGPTDWRPGLVAGAVRMLLLADAAAIPTPKRARLEWPSLLIDGEESAGARLFRETEQALFAALAIPSP